MKLAIIFIFPSLLLSQEVDSTIPYYYNLKDNAIIDTIESIRLKKIVLKMPDLPEFENYNGMKKYYILKRKVFKVYPYSLIVSERLIKLNQRLSKIKTKKDRREYIKIVQGYIEYEFTDTLKKMTQTEGQILCKLIYRQTGKTAFEIISSLRSSWTAFWWNATSYFFNISLKKKYEPEKDEEDKMIENILQRAFFRKELDVDTTRYNENEENPNYLID